jgi:hypothetical protein
MIALTDRQIARLAEYQVAGLDHPATCRGGGGDCPNQCLTPERDGWKCPNCGRQQPYDKAVWRVATGRAA